MITRAIFKYAIDLDLNKNQELCSTIKKKTRVSKINGIFKVSKVTMLYVMLTEWYEHIGINPISYVDKDNLYFIHDSNHALNTMYDSLVGGDGSGKTQDDFLKYMFAWKGR